MRPRRSRPSARARTSPRWSSRTLSTPAPVPEPIARATRALCVGIGGGGDVVGALAFAAHAEAAHGLLSVVGGLTWERRPIDPIPGPRRLDELTGALRLNDAVALARAGTSGPGGFRFAESRMAGFLGRRTVLVDPGPGPAAVGRALHDAARRLGADLVVLLDVGGDVLAHGDEAGLASPLADAVLLAAGPFCAAAGTPVLGALFGAGCDGELLPAEVAARLDELAAAGAPAARFELPGTLLPRLEAAAAVVPTEASAMALRCARGERGPVPIRGGRRTVQLSELGGRLCLFDVAAALAGPARVAALLHPHGTLEDAEARLAARGIRSELAYERDAASSAA